MISQKSLKINTNKKFEIIDITSQINDLIDINKGLISIFSKLTTTAIVVNENEKCLLNDLKLCLNDLISDTFSYQHDLIDNNARSHLKSFLLSSSESLPVKNNKLDLGTWQSVFGSRSTRSITLTMVGE